MHEEPQVPNYVEEETVNQDILLQSGMVLAIEPMLNLGNCEVDGRRCRTTAMVAVLTTTSESVGSLSYPSGVRLPNCRRRHFDDLASFSMA